MEIRGTLVTLAASCCFALTVAPASAGSRGHGGPPLAHGKPAAVKPVPAHPPKPVAVSHPTHAAHAPAIKPGPFVSRIEAHPQLASRLQSLLPTGMTLREAASGFKNQGQFIAAVHVSHNLGIPFAQLKAEMVGPDHDSLGQAIQDLRPGANAGPAIRLAEREAKDDLRIAKVKAIRVTDRDDR